jgi:hypothetical protein
LPELLQSMAVERQGDLLPRHGSVIIPLRPRDQIQRWTHN